MIRCMFRLSSRRYQLCKQISVSKTDWGVSETGLRRPWGRDSRFLQSLEYCAIDELPFCVQEQV